MDNNITDPIAVRHALYAKLGHGALRKTAALHSISLSYLIQMLDGKRTRRPDVFASVATLVGRPVFGFYPLDNNDCNVG